MALESYGPFPADKGIPGSPREIEEGFDDGRDYRIHPKAVLNALYCFAGGIIEKAGNVGKVGVRILQTVNNSFINVPDNLPAEFNRDEVLRGIRENRRGIQP